MKNVKNLLILFGIVLYSSGFFVGANNYNTLYIEKNSSEQNLTGKYFCDYKIDVKVKGPYQYSTCKYYLKYDKTKETLSYISTPSLWGEIQETGYYLLNVNSLGSFDVVMGSVGRSNNTQGVNICQNLKIKGESTGQVETKLEFIGTNGNTGITYRCDNTTNHMEVVGPVGDNTCNTLDLVQGLTIPYEACPCTIDGEAPVVYLTGLSSKFEGLSKAKRITGINNFNLLVYDYASASAKKWDYWFSGNSTKNNTTYVKIDTSKYYLDNQEGVNSGTLKVTVKYLDAAYSGRVDDVFMGSNLSPIAYTGTLKNGSKSITEDTWDGNDRGYWISFKNTSGFLVEKEVKIIIEADDNTFNLGSICKKSSPKHLTGEYTINTKTDPEIEWIYPEDSSSSINPNLTVSMKLSDEWAGIDTGSLVVWATYPVWVAGDTEEDTGEWISITKEYSGDFFTGGMFELTGSGQPGLGNAGSYVVTFTLSDLPTETGIILSGYVKDLADNHTGSQITFYTRMPCSTFGCRDSFKVSWLGWDGNIGNIEFPKGTGSVVILVTGSNNISFAGDGNSELMCGPQREQAYLTGNIKIFDSEGNLINGDYNITDYNNEGVNSTGIYLTGLDVRYDEDSSVLVIDD